VFKTYGETGGGKVRKYIHDAGEAAEFGVEPGNFTEWKDIKPGSDLMFYEGCTEVIPTAASTSPSR
jgi:Phosphoribulokinase